MKKRILFLFLFMIQLTCFLPEIKAQVNASDSLALVDFYNSTNGASWDHRRYWLSSEPVSRWYGVTVKGRRVTGLGLTDNNLTGSLVASFGNLTALTDLNLYNNRIGGSLPSTVGNLTALTSFVVDDNHISGAIPASLGNLKGLTNLDLGINNFSDTIPAPIGNLTNLTSLNLSGNQLTGTVPASFSQLNKLTYILLSSNQLTGEIPSYLYTFTGLTSLFLGGNRFTGTISPSVGNLILLKTLALDDNLLTGIIPSSIGNITGLTELFLQNNQLTGVIPPSLGNCTNLSLLELDHNQLTGNLPATLAKITNNCYLNVSHNHLSASRNMSPSAPAFNIQPDLSYNAFNFNLLEYIATNTTQPSYGFQDTIATHHSQGKLSVSAGGTLSHNTYSWFKEGNGTAVTVIKGDSTFKPTMNGNYYATITNDIATGLTLFSSRTSYTASLQGTAVVNVYPNPARGIIAINGLSYKSNAKITIADMSGYVWLSAQSRQQTVIKLDVSRLKAGNYLVNVNDGKELKTVQFVKE